MEKYVYRKESRRNSHLEDQNVTASKLATPNMEDARLLKKAFEARSMEEGRRGRLGRTWTEEVKTATKKRGIKWEEVKIIVKSRERYGKVHT